MRHLPLVIAPLGLLFVLGCCVLGCESSHNPPAPDGGTDTDSGEVWTDCDDALAGGSDGDACSGEWSCGSGDGCCFTNASCTGDVLSIHEGCLPTCIPGCFENSECGSTEYCAFLTGACGGPGRCMPMTTACPEDCPGVCGCDDQTYCNACIAGSTGSSVAHEGPCSITCDEQDARGVGDCDAVVGIFWNGTACVSESGCMCEGADCASGFSALDECEMAHDHCQTRIACGALGEPGCPPGMFCDYDPDACGAADVPGTCLPIPENCATLLAPACGCDGITYQNNCFSHQTGVDVLHGGPCDSPNPDDDCRASGCSLGMNCLPCFGAFLCLPVGTTC